MPSAASHTITDYEPLLIALQNVLGVVVPEGHRSNLVERVEPVMSRYKLDTLASLADSLQAEGSSEIRSSVLDAISQRQTSWYLSLDIKNILHKYIFAQLPDNARVWVVGCGQGQMAYALAMEIAEYRHRTNETKKIRVFATDSSAANIKQAETALYNEEQLSSLSPEYKKLYTSKTNKGDMFELKSRIRDIVSFSQCSLIEDFQALGPMDLIICPDALVYFSNGVKAGILQQFTSLLKTGGIFLSGIHQTMIPNSEGLERVNHPEGIFYRKIH